MRDKLIELLEQAKIEAHEVCGSMNEGFGAWYADHLLANGVIVLPCKVGQKIYAVGNKFDVRQIKECEAEEFVIYKQIKQVIVCFECDNDCEGCPFNSWVQEFTGEWSCDGECGQALIDFEDFGKTVFLTREEAEAALKEGQE